MKVKQDVSIFEPFKIVHRLIQTYALESQSLCTSVIKKKHMYAKEFKEWLAHCFTKVFIVWSQF